MFKGVVYEIIATRFHIFERVRRHFSIYDSNRNRCGNDRILEFIFCSAVVETAIHLEVELFSVLWLTLVAHEIHIGTNLYENE